MSGAVALRQSRNGIVSGMNDTTNQWLRWGILGGTLLIFFTPLFVSTDLFFPFITGKNFAFRILVELVFALWLILALRDPSARPKRSGLFFLSLLFIVALGVSDFFGADPTKSFWSNFERMEGWVGLAHAVAFFVVLYSAFTEKYWKILWNTAIGVSVLEGLYGVGQLLGWFTINQGGVRLDGTFGNATYLAVYMLFSFFLTALAIVWWGNGQKQKWLPIVYGLAMLLQAVVIFYTATRGTILGLIGGFFIAGIVFLIFGKEYARLRKIGIGALVILILLIGGFYAVRNTPLVQNNDVLTRLASIATPSGLLAQGATRFDIWKMALKGFEERPVLGWGQESFNFVFNQYYQPSLYGQEPWFDRAHNEFLDMLVAGGVVGFLLYVSFFAFALWYLWRPRSGFTFLERGLLTGLLAGYAFHNLFVFDNLVSYFYFFALLAYLGGRANARDPAPALWSGTVAEGTNAIAAGAVVAVMAAVFYFANVPGIATASDIIQGLTSHPEGIATNFDYFKKAAANTGLGHQEVCEQLVQFALQVKSLNAADPTLLQQIEDFADQQMGALVASVPNDARLRVFYGSYLRQIGKLDAANTQLLAAHALSPGKQQIDFELVNLEVDAGNLPSALDWAKQAYESDTSYDLARETYAAVAIRMGNRSLASSLLGNIIPSDSDALLSAYLSVNDYPDVITILKERVTADPNNYETHVQLAAGYLQAGERTNAVSELQEAIKLNPSFEQQGQSYIQQIQSGAL